MSREELHISLQLLDCVCGIENGVYRVQNIFLLRRALLSISYPHSSLMQYLRSIFCWFSLIMKDWMVVFVPDTNTQTTDGHSNNVHKSFNQTVNVCVNMSEHSQSLALFSLSERFFLVSTVKYKHTQK